MEVFDATFKAIADELGVSLSSSLEGDAPLKKVLFTQSELYVRSMLLMARKLSRARYQKKLTSGTLNEALSVKNVSPLLGYENFKDRPYDYVGSDEEYKIYAMKEDYINLAEGVQTSILKYPLDKLPSFHWLATSGTPALIPENLNEAPKDFIIDPKTIREPQPFQTPEQDITFVNTRLELSQFQQKCQSYLKDIFTRNPTSSMQDALELCSKEAFVQLALPIFLTNIVHQVESRKKSEHKTMSDRIAVYYPSAALQLTKMLFQNPNVDPEPHLYVFLQITMTILFINGDENEVDTHGVNLLLTKSNAADFLGQIVRRYTPKYPNLPSRMADNLTVFYDRFNSDILTYSVFLGIYSLGQEITENYLFPLIIDYLEKSSHDPRYFYLVLQVIKRICRNCYLADRQKGTGAGNNASTLSPKMAEYLNKIYSYIGPSIVINKQ